VNRNTLLAVLCAALAAPAGAAEPELNAVLSVMGYGHVVKVLVNGIDVGISGGQSQSMRLFNKGHPWSAKASPQTRKRNFVLVPGENEFVVEFAQNPKSRDRLTVTLEVKGYPAPLLDISNTGRGSDRHVVKVQIEPRPPKDFKPIVIH
jgi:hypothetical protein